ncbi:MAG: YHYH protein [Flavobacteriales bacterium]|nr:YHYH protein [Candidatus Arcticimaribacter sp.]
MKHYFYLLGFSFLVFFIISCSSKEDISELPENDVVSSEVPPIYSKIYNASDIYLEGDFVVIEVNGVPDHYSPYFEEEDSRNIAYDGVNNNFNLNPNRIITTANYTYKIPLEPSPTSSPRPTSLGSIGVAINEVAFFNQYAGPNNQPLTNEINSFDQYNGHPQQQGVYHYHIEPTYLTASKGNDVILGFLLDGYPVYGPFENGNRITNSDLDEFHGHAHITDDFPNGTYHYHITDADPYLNGSGYYGAPGTVTQ